MPLSSGSPAPSLAAPPHTSVTQGPDLFSACPPRWLHQSCGFNYHIYFNNHCPHSGLSPECRACLSDRHLKLICTKLNFWIPIPRSLPYLKKLQFFQLFWSKTLKSESPTIVHFLSYPIYQHILLDIKISPNKITSHNGCLRVSLHPSLSPISTFYPWVHRPRLYPLSQTARAKLEF